MDYDTIRIEQSQDLEISFTSFKGMYPQKPKHICGARKVYYGEGQRIRKIYFSKKFWRSKERLNKETGEIFDRCPACFYEHIFRLTKQVEEEINTNPNSNWSFWEIDKKDFNAFSKLHRKQITRGHDKEPLRYLAIPVTNKSLMVFANVNYENSDPIPRVIPELFGLLQEYVLEMGNTDRVRRSRGFGKNYKGNKGDGRENKPSNDYVIQIYNTDYADGVLAKYGIEQMNGIYNAPIDTIVGIFILNEVEFYINKGYKDIKERVSVWLEVATKAEENDKVMDGLNRFMCAG